MSVLVLGLSHHSAPLALLEQVAVDRAGADRLAARLTLSEAVEGAVVLSTCNRLEVYADALSFHRALTSTGAALAAETGMGLEQLREHLYVHYEDRAVAHAFSVAAGLDSMAVGEPQILGQLREAFRAAELAGRVTEELGSLLRHALHVGKRIHAETGIDQVGHSLASTALEEAAAAVGPIEQACVVVIGAGGMSAVVAAAAARARRLVIVNRTSSRAERLAAATGGQARPVAELEAALAEADIVVSCTGASEHLVTLEHVLRARGASPLRRHQAFVDLSIPRDIDPRIGEVADVRLVDLEALGRRLAQDAGSGELPQVRAAVDLVTAEVAEYLTRRLARRVAPTVAALRARAAEVVSAELTRLDQKAPDLDPALRSEVQRAVHRIVDKLLHTPTVRIKQLSVDGRTGDYETALRELFDLDPNDVATVSSPPDPATLDPGLWGELR